MTQFDLRQALRNLDIEIKPWGYGERSIEDIQDSEHSFLRGYSNDRWLAVNPEERWPVMVTFHEMTHILRGDTTIYKKFGVDMNAFKAGKIPPWDFNLNRLIDYKEENHDIIETECHATAILTCQLTDTPFDLRDEVIHLGQYTQGRDIPQAVMANALKTAKKIWAAGKVDSRSLGWGRRVAA